METGEEGTGQEDYDIVVLDDGETWGSIEGAYVRVDGKVYSLESLCSYIGKLTNLPYNKLMEEQLRVYVDELTNEAVVEREL